MKKAAFFLLATLAGATVLFAATPDKEAVNFAMQLAASSTHAEYGERNALRFFQYTTTTLKDNEGSHVLNDEKAAREAKLTPKDKGRYIAALRDRSGPRVARLWNQNKGTLLVLVPKARYKELAADRVNELLSFRTKPEYPRLLAAMKKKDQKPSEKTVSNAGEVTEWRGYSELAFWYRRSAEGNEAQVFAILKEIQAHYAK